MISNLTPNVTNPKFRSRLDDFDDGVLRMRGSIGMTLIPVPYSQGKQILEMTARTRFVILNTVPVQSRVQ